MSKLLAEATRDGFQSLFYVGLQAFESEEWESTIAWMTELLQYLPPSQERTGPSDHEAPTFRHNDVYDYLGWSYRQLGDVTSSLRFERTFEMTCSRSDPQRHRAANNLDNLLGAHSIRRTDDFEGMCVPGSESLKTIAPALPIVTKFGHVPNRDAGLRGEDFQMRTDNGNFVWATPISRPPGAANVTLLHKILSDEECDALIGIAEPKMEKTVVVDPVSGKEVERSYRTSKGTWLRQGDDPLIEKINIRLAALTNKGMRTHEELHVVHYEPNDKYDPHFDFSDPNRDTTDWSISETAGNRETTLIMYLKDPEEGGLTVFPMSRLSVHPKKGDAVMFQNLHAGGFVDHLTLHGGCPPTGGNKWIATKWIRERDHAPNLGGCHTTTGYYS